jgi:hypothetical protein
VYLLDAIVPEGTHSKTNTLRLLHLQLPEVGAGSGPPFGACVIHHRADELHIQQNSVPDGNITSSVQEGTQHNNFLSSFLSGLIDVRRPGER